MHEVVLPKFDKDYTEACVIAGGDVLTLRFEGSGTLMLFVNTAQNSQRTMGTALDGRRLGFVLPRAVPIDCGRSMVQHARKFGRRVQKMGVEKAGHRIAGLGKLACSKAEREPFFSPKKDLQTAFSKRSTLVESLLETWNVTCAMRCAFVNIGSSKLKRLGPHMLRLCAVKSVVPFCF